MDEFVVNHLENCGCSHVVDIFKDNEVDEDVFRTLTLDDIRVMLPNKVGIQKKIIKVIEDLRQGDKSSVANNNENVLNEYTQSLGATNVQREDIDSIDSTLVKTKEEILKSANQAGSLSRDLQDFMSSNRITEESSLSSTSSSSNANIRGNTNFKEFLTQMTQLKVNVSIQNNPQPPTEYLPHMDPNIAPTYDPPPKVVKKKHVSQKLIQHQQKLPIYSYKEDFIQMIKAHQVLIVVGETGSGKSTQLTQYLKEADFGIVGRIGCTQPRRIAAKSLAKRVAQELGVEVGEEDVGYRIRFETVAQSNTIINYMTDGILLQELSNDSFIHGYSVIMLDEAHERSVNTDILFGLLKKSLRRRPNLKVIVTSATLDSTKFSEYFNYAPVFKIPGRTFEVERIYKGEPEVDYVNTVITTVLSIARYEGPGDILVFLCGSDEIERCCDELMDKDETLYCLPCYASLEMEQQQKVFDPIPDGYTRKVVVATNIAETSLTIDGIVYVVDSGKVKQNNYDPAKGLNTLTTQCISRAQAEQRAGRAGRTRPGKVYRLYSEEAYKKMPRTTKPEIQRANLDSIILLLYSNGVEDVTRFDFIDPPPLESIQTALSNLQDLECLNSENRLTALGRQISQFPLDPRLSKVLITSAELNCVEEVLTIVAVLSATSSGNKLFSRPKKHQFRADTAKATFFQELGDHLVYLDVYNKWKLNSKSLRSKWCRENFIIEKTLIEVEDIKDQIKAIMESHNIRPSKSSSFFYNSTVQPSTIAEAFASGYFSQIARKTGRGHGYVTYSNPNERDQVYIHPASSLFKSKPTYILYDEMINTGNKTNLSNCVAIDPKCIRMRAPHFFKKLIRVFPTVGY